MSLEPEKEKKVLQALDLLMRRQEMLTQLNISISAARHKFLDIPSAFFIWEVVPLTLFADLPEAIRSCWIFIIRGGLPVEPHRHPNSHQRTMSLSGEGDLQTREGSEWLSHPITSDPKASLENRWVSVPANVWHQAVVKSDWLVLSFHTAAENDLLEEAFTHSRPQRKYSSADSL